MKRICLYGASENLGGTEVYLITLVRALKDDIRFDYLLKHDYGPMPFEDEIISYGGKVYREYYECSERQLPGYISPKKILEKHPEWDGIYLNLQSIDTSYRLLIEAKKRNVSHRIIHSHNNINDFSQRSVKDWLYSMFFKFTKKCFVTNFLACSTLAGKSVYGKKSSFTVVPDAVDFYKFQINEKIRDTKRKEYKLCEDEIVIGFSGRFSKQKNLGFLLEIFSELKKQNPKFRLLLMGDGELRTDICAKAKKLGIFQDVIFTGSVIDTYLYYHMMDCFVLPSRYEGFGIVLLEAQAAGLRCYTTAKVVPEETNITGRVTFIDSKLSAFDWANKIRNTGFDRNNCLELLNSSEYTVEALKNKLLDILGNEE